MRRIVGPILALFGIFLVFGLVAGAAYTAGLGAAGVVVTPASGAVAPVVTYPWFGLPFFGFGFFHLIGFLLVVFLFFGLLRLAFGGGHRGRHGWGPGYGYGPGGRHGGWGPGSDADGPHTGGDPREAWIRGRLDDWHRTAHAATPNATAGSATGGTGDPTGSTDPGRPAEPPTAG